MRKGFKIFLFIVLIVVFMGITVYVGGSKNMDEVEEFIIPFIDLSTIEDGMYEGSCDIGRWAMDVKVSIKDHQIVNVLISEEKLSNITADLAADWNKNILFVDHPVFDAITGATITSKAYMIAITDALK